MPLWKSQTMWQIRFRITDNASPGLFEFASDLLYANPTPWLIWLQARTNFMALRELLTRDELDFDSLAKGSVLGILKGAKLSACAVYPYLLGLARILNFKFKWGLRFVLQYRLDAMVVHAPPTSYAVLLLTTRFRLG
ncbi:hypothetical protein FIBSPDRAFT_1023023 [Athelia psychrophila]|uniref:Uncharacterized protein n=1 Tax=Athelia psychrophila TaxID=1759441 RepID=A0A166ITW2_9AGAM|nr:hypothetical protein FIBSPDRAFT_1023023 [Fibularhizoctonia sp. CBS 109695]